MIKHYYDTNTVKIQTEIQTLVLIHHPSNKNGGAHGISPADVLSYMNYDAIHAAVRYSDVNVALFEAVTGRFHGIDSHTAADAEAGRRYSVAFCTFCVM